MSSFQFLQPLVPMLSAVLATVLVDVALRFLVPPARDRFDPLLGIPARVAQRLESKLNRVERTLAARGTRGLIALLVLLALGVVLGAGLTGFSKQFEMAIPVIFFLCFRVTYPWTAGHEVLKASGVAGAVAVLARRRVHVAVPTKNPDKHAVLRMVIESAALSLHLGLLTPVFWAALGAYFHVSAVFTVALVVTLLEAVRVVVTTENTHAPFARPFRMVELVLNFVPARIAAVLWILAAVFTPKTSQKDAWDGIFNQSAKHRLYNEGWPIAAVAGALNIALPGGAAKNDWIGPKKATAQVSPPDLRRALWLHAVALGLVVLVFTAMIFLGLSS